MLLTYIYIDIVPDVPDTSGESKNNIGAAFGGPKTMTGLLASQGIRVAEKRVGEALKQVAPHYHVARQKNTARQLNPLPYIADYFGQKLHIDQNEKLVMYGVTYVMAIDGYSRKIVAFLTMPIKNCVEIYEHLARYANCIIYRCHARALCTAMAQCMHCTMYGILL